MNYDELESLAAVSEKAGGYGHTSGGDVDAVEIPDGNGGFTRLEGREAFAFLQHLLRRSQNREAELQGVEGYDKVVVEQAQRDARREVLAAVREATEHFQ